MGTTLTYADAHVLHAKIHGQEACVGGMTLQMALKVGKIVCRKRNCVENSTCKKLMGQTLFRLVYGVEVVMPMEYIVPSLHIVALTGMTDRGALEERLT